MANMNPKQTMLVYNLAPIGNFRDWLDPSNPKGSTVQGVTNGEWGTMPVSLSHPYRNGQYQSGGSWVCEKYKIILHNTPGVTYRAGYGIAYEGSYKALNDTPMSEEWYLSGSSAEDAHTSAYEFGAQALAALRPDRPDFDFIREVVELKDVFKEITKRWKDFRWAAQKEQNRLRRKYGKRFSQKAADDYIAVNFGWIPLVNSVIDFVEAYTNLDKRVAQVIRDANRPVRRSGTLLIYKDDPVNTWYQNASFRGHPKLSPGHVSQCYAPGYASQTRTTFSRRVWFSGRSRYRLPPHRSHDELVKKLRKRLMGGRFTMNQLYNLIPWSWFVDYFVGLGHFIAANEPGVGERWTIDYAFIMDKRVKTRHLWYYHKPYPSKDAYLDNASVPWNVVRYTTESKRMVRSQASIFGWGFSQEDLSPWQLSILGALGYSRL